MYAVLVTCLVAFALRVAAQLLVAIRSPRWLPPMAAWQSGLLPYPVLLASQALILALQAWVVTDVADGGAATIGDADAKTQGLLLLAAASAYAIGMAYRARRRRRFDLPHWWSRGVIPIAFHLVLAAFIAAWGIIALRA